MRRVLLCEYVGGETRLSNDGAALLVGISAEELLSRWDPASGVDALPADWKRRGAKRSRHARNAVGDNAATVVLAFLAMRDWRARIDFDEAAGQMWAVLDDTGGG
jgi:hypothetical protein